MKQGFRKSNQRRSEGRTEVDGDRHSRCWSDRRCADQPSRPAPCWPRLFRTSNSAAPPASLVHKEGTDMDFDEISKLFAVIESGMKNHPGKYPHIMAAANNRLQEIENDLALSRQWPMKLPKKLTTATKLKWSVADG